MNTRPRHFLPSVYTATRPFAAPTPHAGAAEAGNGPLAGYTNVFDFNLVNFDWITWHEYEWQNWVQVDALLNAAIGFLNIRGIWRPLVAYLIGEIVYDPDDVSSAWRCMISHTSSTDFAVDKPLYWTVADTIGPPVESVFGRIGVVVATAGDYDAFYYNKTAADARYINTAGDTFTGPISWATAPSSGSHLTNKTYVDATAAAGGIGTFLPLTGGTLSDMLQINHSSPKLRFHETDAVEPKGHWAIEGYGAGSTFRIGRATATDWSTIVGFIRFLADDGTAPNPDRMLFDVPIASVVTIKATAPQLAFDESDVVSPAGQYRFLGSSDNFSFQRALTANFATVKTLWTGNASAFNTYVPFAVDLTAAGAGGSQYPYTAHVNTGTTAYVARVLDGAGAERMSLYSSTTNQVVLRNRDGTASTVSYIQLNADSTAILSGSAGITITGNIDAGTYNLTCGAITSSEGSSFTGITADSINAKLTHPVYGGYVTIGSYDASRGNGSGQFYWDHSADTFTFRGDVTAQTNFRGSGDFLTDIDIEQITHTAGVVNSYRWLLGTGGGDNLGDNVAGSSLRTPFFQVHNTTTAMNMAFGGGPAGTWEAYQTTTSDPDEICAGLWLRLA